jgi:hypothetical protein
MPAEAINCLIELCCHRRNSFDGIMLTRKECTFTIFTTHFVVGHKIGPHHDVIILACDVTGAFLPARLGVEIAENRG